MNPRFSKTAGFSLVELMVVIAVVSMLAVLTYAPYSYYSDIAKVRISAEKIEQTFSEAKLSSAMGLSVPGTDFNGDAYVVLEKGSGSLALFAAKAQSGFAVPTEYELLRSVPLEKDVTLSDLPADSVTIKFSAPSGKSSAVDGDGNPLVFSGGTVGLKWSSIGKLSKPFRNASVY